MVVRTLPVPLARIAPPGHLGVTQLAASGDCLLKAIAPRHLSAHSPVSPFAVLGTLSHSLIESVAKGHISTSRSDIAAHFDRLVESKEADLKANEETAPFADLRAAFTRTAWEKQRFFAIQRAEQVADASSTQNPDRGDNKNAQLSLKTVLGFRSYKGSEVPFVSEVLRLKGKIDFVRVDGSVITIWDFKTGDVTDDQGQVDELTSLQMRLYALAVLEHRPDARLELRVADRRGISIVALDRTLLDEVETYLTLRWSRLDEQSVHTAESLSTVGPHCRYCKLRPACAKYRDSIPELWTSPNQNWPLPLDTARVHYRPS